MRKAIILVILLGGIAGAVYSQVRVGIAGTASQAVPEGEMKYVISGLRPFSDLQLTMMSTEDLVKKGKKLSAFDVIWLQWSDTTFIRSLGPEDRLLKVLNEYLQGGGRLLLGPGAFRMINLLGLETEVPATVMKPCIDEGYGRKLGFHAFRDHPIFQGLNGGAYIQRPVSDTTVAVTGFFGDQLPAAGKVIAVDWDYIFLREETKIVIEYKPGRGKVIAVGGYLSFAAQNLNREHLALFTANTLRYLGDRKPGSDENYWYFGPYEVRACGPDKLSAEHHSVPLPAEKWNLPAEKVRFNPRPATENSWDLAGQRMVVMGVERSGIEEIWTHPFMALRDYEAGIRTGGRTEWLADLTPEITVSPSFLLREYAIQGGTLTETIVVSPSGPGGVIHYEYSGSAEAELVIRFSSNLRLMWPYSEKATGVICHQWDPVLQAFRVTDRTGEMVVIAGANREPSDRQVRAAQGELKAGFTLAYPLAQEDRLDFVVTGTAEGEDAALNSFAVAAGEPRKILDQAVAHTQDVLDKSLAITTPNDTFNEGYLWSLIATDRFYVTTPGMGSSLVAGYSTTRRGWDGAQKVNGRPGYAWYFGRDGQWSGLALLDYGDYGKVKDILSFFQKYQDLSGKIFHEATTSGVIHYDAADATPLYILLAGRYYRYSNDTAFLRQSWPNIRKAIDFCLSTDTDRDNLIENTNVGHGWIEGGELYGSHATLYLNACWAAALEEAWNMAGFVNDPERDRFMARHHLIMNIINREFWRASPALGGPARDVGFYSYGKNKDGSFRSEIISLPAVAIYFGLTESGKAKTMLDHYAGNAFSANWGVRIIGDDSPLYKPTGYHYGSIWPLFTGWTALAEYRAGNDLSGFSHLMNNLNVYRNWSLGTVEEVLNGAVYQPSGVCPHQCWSETMVLQPAIEGMLGLNVKAGENRLTLAPRFPVNWDSFDAEHIRIGNRFVNFSFRRNGTVCTYTFDPGKEGRLNIDFHPSFPAGTFFESVHLNGNPVPFSTFSMYGHESMVCSFTIDGPSVVEIIAHRGIGLEPLIQQPAPGDSAAGNRIISTRYASRRYTAEVEGLAGTTGEFRLRILNGTPMYKLVNADIFMTGQDRFLLKVNFKGDTPGYVRRTVYMEIAE